MNTKHKIISLAVLVSVLLSVGGCPPPSTGGTSTAAGAGEIRRTPSEEKKARLLRQLDRKYENPDAHFELGQLYHRDGLWTQAEYHYNIAMSFDPAHRNSQAGMVKVLLDSGDTTKAKLSKDIYINQVCGSAAESLKLGLAFQNQVLDDYALACYRQALTLAPNSAKVNRQIGYYYLTRNDKDRARDYLSRSFQLNPNQPEVAGELGRLGVAVRIPRKVERNTKKLDRIVEQSDTKASP